MQQPYPEKAEEQGLYFPFEGLDFLSLNSAWQIDAVFPKRAAIHPGALECALKQIRPGDGKLRIAVLHHAVNDNEKIADTEWFMQRLGQAGVRLLLHGDVHESRDTIWNPQDSARSIHVVGAGSFAVGKDARPDSVPRLYNLIEVQRDLRRITIRTRKQERKGGSWSPYARWPARVPNQLKDSYEIQL